MNRKAPLTLWDITNPWSHGINQCIEDQMKGDLKCFLIVFHIYIIVVDHCVKEIGMNTKKKRDI